MIASLLPARLTHGVRAVTAILVNTFREAVRNKVFGSLLFFAVGIILFAIVLGEMSLHQEVRLAENLTLFASTIFSMVITIYVSINLFHTEIERRTIYTILSKPVPRWQFLLGKYFGILALMVVIVGFLGGVSAGVIAVQGGDVGMPVIWAFALVFLQQVVVAAVSMLFASFSTPLLSGMIAAAVFLLGHLHPQLDHAAEALSENGIDVGWLVDGVKFILPDLHSLNIAGALVHDVAIPTGYLLSASWYAFSYAGVVLFAAMLIFARRDLL